MRLSVGHGHPSGTPAYVGGTSCAGKAAPLRNFGGFTSLRGARVYRIHSCEANRVARAERRGAIHGNQRPACRSGSDPPESVLATAINASDCS
jgi:hypothetical protein